MKLENLISVLCPSGVAYSPLGALCKIETGKLNANIFKHDGKRSFFNSTDRFLGAGKNDFLFGGEVIVDAAVLQLCRLAEIFRGGNGQPLFDKAAKAGVYKLLSLFSFLFFPQNTIPHFCALSNVSYNSISDPAK